MNSYFDDYFDMVYFIHIPSRVDKYKNIIELFNILNIKNYKHIIPIDQSILINDFKLGPTAQSCMYAHRECYEDAVRNNYNKIMIFEDDACLNTVNPDIQENLEQHLNTCFTFLKKNEKYWNLFYFDNIEWADRINNKMRSYLRVTDEDNLFKNVPGKRYTHSYAINLDTCKKMIDTIDTCTKKIYEHVDLLLFKLPVNYKWVYTPGIFDQLLNLESDNSWGKKI